MIMMIDRDSVTESDGTQWQPPARGPPARGSVRGNETRDLGISAAEPE